MYVLRAVGFPIFISFVWIETVTWLDYICSCVVDVAPSAVVILAEMFQSDPPDQCWVGLRVSLPPSFLLWWRMEGKGVTFHAPETRHMVGESTASVCTHFPPAKKSSCYAFSGSSYASDTSLVCILQLLVCIRYLIGMRSTAHNMHPIPHWYAFYSSWYASDISLVCILQLMVCIRYLIGIRTTAHGMHPIPHWYAYYSLDTPHRRLNGRQERSA
jgi:hypothetical protein